MGEPRQKGRRMDTETTREPSEATKEPTHPDMHHVYLNVDTGAWGDRSSLVILTLTDSELETFASLTDTDRAREWGKAHRYFGETWGGSIRRHLSMADKPKMPGQPR